MLDALYMAMGPLGGSFVSEQMSELPSTWHAADGHHITVTNDIIHLSQKTDKGWICTDVRKCMAQLQNSPST
jgi:hypothetical protein